jgi:hypothetical protein
MESDEPQPYVHVKIMALDGDVAPTQMATIEYVPGDAD